MSSFTESLRQFFEAWKKQDWAAMAGAAQLTWRSKFDDPADWLRQCYQAKPLSDFEVGTVEHISETAVRVQVFARYRHRGFKANQQKIIAAMVIQESAAYRPDRQGQWGVNPISTLRDE